METLQTKVVEWRYTMNLPPTTIIGLALLQAPKTTSHSTGDWSVRLVHSGVSNLDAERAE